MPDAHIASAIVNRLGEDKPTSQTHRPFTSKLPVANPTLMGREEQIAFLDLGRSGHECGPGDCGRWTGKTALVDN
jgi:hypothetical protein